MQFTPSNFTPNPGYRGKTTLGDLAGNIGGIDASRMAGNPMGQLLLGATAGSFMRPGGGEPQGNSIRRLLGMQELSFAPDAVPAAAPQQEGSPWGWGKSKQFLEFAADLDPNDPVDRARAYQWEQDRERQADAERRSYAKQQWESPETQKWVSGMTDSNRRIYRLMAGF